MILSAPPMAAAFFQGTLGQFNSYSPFGNVAATGRGGGGGFSVPGTYRYAPPKNQAPRGNDARRPDSTRAPHRKQQVAVAVAAVTLMRHNLMK
jgi:type IV secretion system protein VirB6